MTLELNGVPTWYQEWGSAPETLVLLHGGFSDSRDFAGNLSTLARGFTVLAPDRRGHGRTGDIPGPITLSLMADDMTAFCEQAAKRAGGPVDLAGYSVGGTIALLVALRRPDLVGRLVLISAAFAMDGMLIGPSGDGGDMPEQVVGRYAEVSPDGRDHFPVFAGKVMAGMAADPLAITADDLARVSARTLVVAGDDDLVRAEHTLALFRGLPDAELAVVPRTSHLLLLEKPALCAQLVGDFLAGPPAPTFMPIRRANQTTT
ncbi:MAG: alpha/beta hydrolase [Nonomuraea sp.]|nr:alpha/beta hydrolase [Nonomuraea sp.]